MMHRRIGILLAVALLVAGLAAPANAKRPDLNVTVEPSSGFMWANSVGDEIEFDISVTNKSRVDLYGISVNFDFDGTSSSETHIDLEKNQTWTTQYPHAVLDLDGLEPMEQTGVVVGTVTATVGSVTAEDDAIMTAYPVDECPEPGFNGSFEFTTDLPYEVCSFSGTGYWTLTTLPEKPIRGKRIPPSATVRDGVPGNWCNEEQTVIGNTVIDTLNLPVGGECLGGGAGGDTIPVRNTNLFYLATWKGNIVTAAPQD